jgi:hypothetical protein
MSEARMPDVTTPPVTLTKIQREALGWAWRTLHRRYAGRQPNVAVLKRLAAMKLITFTTHISCRMAIVRDVVLTEEGERVYLEGCSA